MIETTITKIQYDADGVQRRWSIPFPYADVKHISIYTKVGEEPTVKVVDNYDIDEDDAVVIYPTVASGQEPLASGTKITIARETPETQLEDASQVHFTSKDVERGLDKLTMITQELSTTSGETMEVSAAAFEAAEEAVDSAAQANKTAEEAKTIAGKAVGIAEDAKSIAQGIDPGISEGDGVKGDYCTTYGIIDAPNGILTNPSGMEVVLKQGVVLQLAGQDIKTTISGDLTHTITSTADCDLFYVSGTTSLMEVAEIVWSRIEPDNGQAGVLAWWNPNNKKWKFKSNDTGNVWAEAVATPVAHIHTNGTTITRIDHIGYRILDDEVYALKSDLSLSRRPLGEVYFSQSSLATDNPGALPGWTGEYYENGKTLFPDLYNFVKAHSELQVTKAQYDSAVAAFGECPKYVVDENTAQTSLRLPKYSRSHGTVIKEKKPTSVDPTWYRQWSDGWLEQGGIVAGNGVYGLTTVTLLKPYSSVNYIVKANILWDTGWYTAPGPAGLQGVTDAASIPTNYTTISFALQSYTTHKWEAKGQGADDVQENTLYPWISAYTSAVPASTAQAAEFTNALTGKANTDLSNVLANIDYVVDSKIPTESDPSWYRKYKSGWLEQGGQTAGIAGSTPTTVTLLKPYNNTAYNVIVQPVGAYTKSGEANNVIPTRTTTNFILTSGQIATQPFIWRAEGQGA